jgi:hypothetical protein
MAGHRQEADVDVALLATTDLVGRRTHVVVDAKLSETIRALTSSGHWQWASRLLRRVVRTSNVDSMEKLLVAHPWKFDHRSGSGCQCGGRTPVTTLLHMSASQRRWRCKVTRPAL